MKKFFTLIATALVAMSASAQVLVSYPATTDAAGYTVSGTTTESTIKIHTNTDEVSCLKLANGYTADGEFNGNAIILKTDGGFKAGDTLTIAGAASIKESDVSSKRATVVLIDVKSSTEISVVKTFADFINGRLSDDEPVKESYVLEADADSLVLGRSGNTGACITYINVTRKSGPEVVWTTTALVSIPGTWEEAQRTLNYMSDGTFVVKNLFGEGSSDLVLSVSADGHVDFANSTMDSYYYTYQKVTGYDAIYQLFAYAAYYYSYTLDNNGDYYQLPGKLGGELIMNYVGAWDKSYNYVGDTNKRLYICWGKTRLAGTKDYEGVASLVYTPKEGTVATDGDWATDNTATIGFYYDELVGDTAYRVNRFYGADKYFHFKVTDNGYLTYTNQYLWTGNETIPCIYAYDGNYSYTEGDGVYYIKDLTKVRNGEIGFYAYGYDADNKTATGATNWQKNYYIFDWENTDITVDGVSAVRNIESTNDACYNLAGQRVNNNAKGLVIKAGKKYMVK